MLKIVFIFIVLLCSVNGCGRANIPAHSGEESASTSAEETKSVAMADDISRAVTEAEAEGSADSETIVSAEVGVVAQKISFVEHYAYLSEKAVIQVYPGTKIIGSVAELEDYQKEYSVIFDFGCEYWRGEKWYPSFESVIQSYDEDWFAEHKLVIRTISSHSIGYDYKVTSVSLEKDVLNIHWERHIPLEMSPMEFAEFMILEIDVADIPETASVNWERVDVPWSEET